MMQERNATGGQPSIYAEARNTLLSGSHVIIHGTRALGTETLGNALLRTLQGEGFAASVVFGSAATEPHVSHLGFEERSSPLASSESLQTLKTLLEDERPQALLVLNPHRLDSRNVGLLMQFASQQSVRLIIVIDTEQLNANDSRRLIVRIQTLNSRTFKLSRLNEEESHAYIGEAAERIGYAPGKFSIPDCTWITANSGGYPQLIDSLVEDLATLYTNGPLEYASEAGTFSARSIDLAWGLMRSLSPSRRETLLRLAMLDGVERTRMSLVIENEEIGFLVNLGLIKIVHNALLLITPLRIAIRHNMGDLTDDPVVAAVNIAIAEDAANGWTINPQEVLLSARWMLANTNQGAHSRAARTAILSQASCLLTRRGEGNPASAMARAALGSSVPPPAIVSSLLQEIASDHRLTDEHVVQLLTDPDFADAPPWVRDLIVDSVFRPCSSRSCSHETFIAAIEKSDPLQAGLLTTLRAHALARQGRFQEALELAESVQSSDPRERLYRLETRIICAFHLGRIADARKAADTFLDLYFEHSTSDIVASGAWRAICTQILSVLAAISAFGCVSDLEQLERAIALRSTSAAAERDIPAIGVLIVTSAWFDTSKELLQRPFSAPEAMSTVAPGRFPESWTVKNQGNDSSLTVHITPHSLPVGELFFYISLLVTARSQSTPEEVLTLAQELRDGPGRVSVPARIVAAYFASGDRPQASAALNALEESDLDVEGELLQALLRAITGIANENYREIMDAAVVLRRHQAIRESDLLFERCVTLARSLSEIGARTNARAYLRRRRNEFSSREASTAELTSRELEIVQLAAGGLSNKSIAKVTYLSVRTVESHMYSAIRKLGVPNRQALSEIRDLNTKIR
ncbi:helix-turn-helix transcriptional regulator [Humidisolicoccus flavus]|uniref:helix-turn-helix transcriptional regulator n=1 Tax=Humidisolicoccus flavus TaxID=3111414 RepID=UPI003249B6E6